MQPQALLAVTWRQLRDTRAAWAAGLLGAAGNVLLGFWLRQAARPALWREPLRLWWESQTIPVTPLLLWGGGAVLLALLAWLLALHGEAALIATALDKPQPWREARQWIVRFVAIDTLVFLPLLMLGLIVLALLIILLAASLVVALRSDEPRAILLGAGGLAMLCSTSVLVLLLPLGMFTVLFRLLAFRAVGVEGLGARPALRRAWAVVRQSPGSTALAAVVLWGLAYGASIVLSTVFLLLHFATALPEAAIVEAGRLTRVLQIGLALLEWAPRAALFAFLGLGWTHAYRQLARNEVAS
ncbi:MAG: hypothetical protein RRC07_01570 [Anaerolineae bacterium]|nr:hypothetical protein [Anaerolineae bacterium]